MGHAVICEGQRCRVPSARRIGVLRLGLGWCEGVGVQVTYELDQFVATKRNKIIRDLPGTSRATPLLALRYIQVEAGTTTS